MKSIVFFQSVLLLAIISFVAADTPANCTYEDIRGYWIFHESDRIASRNENCNNVPTSTKNVYIKLDFPNVAVDNFGNEGQWTLIYNQGFEVIINYRKYFAFSLYKKQNNNTVSYCNATFPGWSHDLLDHNWACFQGQKVKGWKENNLFETSSIGPVKQSIKRPLFLESVPLHDFLGKAFVRKINSQQSSWTAKVYPKLQSFSKEQLIRMAGGRASILPQRPKPSKFISSSDQLLIKQLPESFDWRDVNGINYISPVRNQLNCGSCYVFSSMALLEARVRIATNNSETPVFSTQNVVDCSEYSQGCDGGFPYLIAGKYAQDFGVIAESCYPYIGFNGKCKKPKDSKICHQRTYTYRYHYVGGYYGATNEDLMRLELVKNGPVVVGFEVYPNFLSYSSGVYNHTAGDHLLKDTADFNPFELTSHAVLVVGYGFDSESGQKYWIVKNSWGTDWGMDGYFWIKRGTDLCGIESLAVAATPIP